MIIERHYDTIRNSVSRSLKVRLVVPVPCVAMQSGSLVFFTHGRSSSRARGLSYSEPTDLQVTEVSIVVVIVKELS